MKSDNPSASHRTAHVSLMVLTVLLTTWGAALATLWAGSNKWTSIGPFGGSIQAVAIDPQNPSTLYAGTSSGIFKSTDGGASWNALNNAIAWNLAIDPRTPSTLYAGGFGVFKSKRLEFRWEALNALNHPQFTQFPERDVTSPGPVPGSPSRFLNRDFTDSGIRSMWVQLKVLF